jgi:hypothetical protein
MLIEKTSPGQILGLYEDGDTAIKADEKTGIKASEKNKMKKYLFIFFTSLCKSFGNK